MIYLLKAIKYFNPELGFLFETYAEQAIRSHLKIYEQTKDRSIPVVLSEKRKKLRHFLFEKIGENKQDDISENWIMEFTEEHPEFPIKEVRYTLLFIFKGIYIHWGKPVGYGGEYTLSDVFPDERITIEREFIYKKDLQKIYSWIMKEIKKRKRPDHYRVIVKDILFSEEPKQLTEIARQFNITKQAVYQAKLIIIDVIKNRFQYAMDMN